MSKTAHYRYDSERFEATEHELAIRLIDVAEWMQRFKDCEVFVRLPLTVEFDRDFTSDKRIARVMCRISVIKKREVIVDG